MKKLLLITLFLSSSVWAQAPDWNTCQYQQNPQQCMQGIPAWQQSPAPIQQQGSGVTQGRQIQLQGMPDPNRPQQINPTQKICMPNGYGGFNCN
jgi:NADPH-dependent glutamate synthase beta subunit-like oxidoreductase